MKKIFIAAFGAETNSFSPMMTTLSHFKENCLIRPTQNSNKNIANDGHGEFIRLAKAYDYEIVRGTFAYATPSGPLTQETYELLRNEIISQLEQALPVDFILLNLHGAMLAKGYDDCEGDFLEHIRQIAGNDIPVGGLLDPHAHLSERMIKNATSLVAYKEYPHTDFAESARKLFHITERAAKGDVKPEMTFFDCQSLGSFPTPKPPMRPFVDLHLLGTANHNILDCSMIHSFPWGDSPDAGVKILVTTDNDKKLATDHAAMVGAEFKKIRQEATQKFTTVPDALRSINTSLEKPVIIADSADNPGGGASGDATYLLHEILERKIGNAAFGIFWDSQAIDKIFSAGPGATLDISLGGKGSNFSGSPLNLTVDVLGLLAEGTQSFGDGKDRRSLSIGKCAAVSVNDVDIIISNKRVQILSPDIFLQFGLEPSSYDLIVVKSSNHFQAAFKHISSNIIYVMAPGMMSMDFSSLPYRKIPRPIWPLDDI